MSLNKIFLIFIFPLFLLNCIFDNKNDSNELKNPIKSWQTVETGSEADFLSTYFFNKEVGWIFGRNGVFLRTINGGDSWIIDSIITAPDINDIYFVTKDTGWAIGETLLSTTDGGITWTEDETPRASWLYSIHFTNRSTGYIAAGSGIIHKTTDGGLNWQAQDIPVNALLRDVNFMDENRGWAVGSCGYICNTTDGGSTWNTIRDHNCSNQDLHRILIVQNSLYALGENGAFLISENQGLNWDIKSSNISDNYQGGYFKNKENGWLIGMGGAIYFTSNGGNYWATQHPNLIDIAVSYHFLDESFGWVVGWKGLVLKGVPDY